MELAFSMPGHLKIRDGRRKHVVKEALAGLLPDSILNRSKEGFSIPMKQWLRKELRPMMERLLAPERLASRGIVDSSEARRLVDEHCSGRANHAHVLFSLMVFERWAEEFAI
jgi:asparagine synthase (glutamine-hydrolysing)